MLTEERYHIILEKLKMDGIVSVNELINSLETSESTIRRDLNSLHKLGKLKKVHGGAVLLEDNYAKGDFKVSIRKGINIKKKTIIARYAASLVKDNDVIYIDAGTTTEIIIDYITAKNITVVTNGIGHAKSLLEKNIKTYILGGEIKSITEAVVGITAVDNLQSYNFSKGFFGANGISENNGYTTPDLNEAMVKTEAIKRCAKTYILVDNSKFEETSFITFCRLQDAIMITDEIDNISYDAEIIEANKKI